MLSLLPFYLCKSNHDDSNLVCLFVCFLHRLLLLTSVLSACNKFSLRQASFLHLVSKSKNIRSGHLFSHHFLSNSQIFLFKLVTCKSAPGVLDHYNDEGVLTTCAFFNLFQYVLNILMALAAWLVDIDLQENDTTQQCVLLYHVSYESFIFRTQQVQEILTSQQQYIVYSVQYSYSVYKLITVQTKMLETCFPVSQLLVALFSKT